MHEDLWKIGGVLVISIFIIYLIINIFMVKQRNVEGLENQNATGEAGLAASYAAAIKAKTVQLQDGLLITKYRKDYENVIINMDDYVNALMLKTLLDIDSNADTKSIIGSLTQLNTLSSAKKSLNETMVFIDKQ
jgi:hypothetical protein